LPHGEVAIELPVNLRDIDLSRALESAELRNLNHPRIHRRLDRALHHQGVAIGDLDALELDVRANGQLATNVFARRCDAQGQIRGGVV
jgi:hypothetical protein